MAGTEKTPAFQFYPKDFLSSDAVSLMTTEQIGAYTLLLCHAWLRPEGLPSDLSSLAKLARCPEARFVSKVWPGVSSTFKRNDDGLLFNARLERSRAEQQGFKAERSQSGKRGAATRWARSHDGSAIKQPLANDSSSSASASSSAKEGRGGADAPTTPTLPVSIHGRRNLDLMTYGPIKLWASQFRDEILPLVATHFSGDRDKADGYTRAWIRELDAANQATTPSREALANMAKWWSAQARERWGAQASVVDDPWLKVGAK